MAFWSKEFALRPDLFGSGVHLTLLCYVILAKLPNMCDMGTVIIQCTPPKVVVRTNQINKCKTLKMLPKTC